jgi:hypothetical protein
MGGTALASEPPVVTDFSVSGSPSASGTLTFSLAFSAPVSGLERADLSLSGDGSPAAGCSMGDPAGGPSVYSIGVTGCADGTVQLVLAAGSVALAAPPGTVGPVSASVSAVGAVDRTRPAVSSFVAVTAAPITGSTIEYSLTFSEPVAGLTAASFRVFPETASQPWSVTSVTGAEATYSVTLSRTTTSSGTVTLRLRQNAVADAAGNLGPNPYVEAPAVSYAGPGQATATVTINGGAATTVSPDLKLALSTTGLGSDAQMRFSVDAGSTWTAWQDFAASRDLPLAARHPWGTVQVVGQFRDGGGLSTQASASIQYGQAQRSTMALKASYLIKASLSYSAGTVNADQTVDLVNQSDQLIGWLDFSVFARQYDKLVVSTASVQGKSVSPTYTNKANMRVPLGFNLRPGETARVRIVFVATANANTSSYQHSRLAKADGVMQVSSWHPLLSDGHPVRMPGDGQFSAAGDYRLELTHPSGIKVAAPGTLVSSTSTSKVYTLANAREYAFAVSPDFATTSATTAQGVQVVVYYVAGTSGAATARNAAVQALEKHHQLGAYPYSRLVIAHGTRTSVALEYSGMIFMGRSVMGSALTIAHEVAHQWWYGIVGNDQLRDPWLDEAFSEFTSTWYSGKAMPTYCSNKPVSSSIYDFPDKLTYGCDSYGDTVYKKGAVFLNGIRVRMGDTPFLNALKAIVAENRYGIVTTPIVREAFVRFAADKAGLNAYMDQFLTAGSSGGTDPANAPQVSPPGRVLFAPQALSSTVSVRVSWAPATGALPIDRYELQRKKGTNAWVTVALPTRTATSVDVAVQPGASYRFRVRAVDSGGNVSAWASTGKAKVFLVQENASGVTYSGSWARVALSGASGGYVRHSTAAGAAARLTFTGSSIALVSTRGPGRGIAEVWLDGSRVATVDLYAASVQKARVVWAAAVAAGSHQLEVRVTGTRNAAATAARVDIDALLVHP